MSKPPIYRVAFLLILVMSMALFSNVEPAAAHNRPLFRVYLTFEDGPTDAYTGEILDILAQYNAKATFFPNGYQIQGREAILNRIVREGHAIGNHLWEEPDHYYGSDPDRIREGFFRSEEALRAALGPDELAIYDAQTKIFRYPGGSGAPFPETDGVNVITYNTHVDSDDCGWWLDSSGNYDAAVIDNVLNEPVSEGGARWNAYEYGDGVLIAFHDINRVPRRVLPVIMDELQAAGATFEALPRPWDEAGTMPIQVGVPPQMGAGVPGTVVDATTHYYANFRAAPSLDGERISETIPPYTTVQVIGRHDDWMQVSYDGLVGWVASSNMKVFGPIPSLPFIP